MAIELLAVPADRDNALYFEQVDDIGFVRVDEIDLDERLRPVDPIHAQVVGAAMAREGQATPIVVCRVPGAQRWTLVAGAHRVEGAKWAGIEALKAEIIGSDKLLRRQREISENLWRKDLEPWDRAAFIDELVRLHKLRAGIQPGEDGRKASAAARWQKEVQDQADDTSATLARAYGWADDVAQEIGLSRRTVYNDLLIFTRIVPSLMARLRAARHPVARNAGQLKALAKLDPAEQDRVASALLDIDDPAKSVADAWNRVGAGTKAPADPETKRLSAFLGAFSRMSLAEKKGALAHLAAQLPAGFALVDPAAQEKPGRMAMIEIGGAIERGFNVMVDLMEGEEGVDDDRLSETAGALQGALDTVTALLGRPTK